jgi:hypothetical protein
MADRMARGFSGNERFRATSWSFDLLCKPQLTSIIFGDSTPADIIIVATNGEEELPERVAIWVELCMQVDSDAKPVIVALHDEKFEAEGTAAPLCLSLTRIADRRDATFLCSTDLAPCMNHKAPTEPIAAQESPAFAIQNARYASSGSPRWWGIND